MTDWGRRVPATARRPGHRPALRVLLCGVLLAVAAGCGSDARTASAATSIPGPASPTTVLEKLCTTDVGIADPSTDEDQAMAGMDMSESGTGGSSSGVPSTSPPDCILPAAEQPKFDAEIALARASAVKYPTVADALADGWTSERAPSQRVEGAVHLYKVERVDDRLDFAEPEMLLYSRNAPDGRLLAVVYYDLTDSNEPPAGFTGPNDRWHHHSFDRSVCTVDGAAKTDLVTAESCSAVGGRWVKSNAWMLHVWVVPGRSNPAGLFAINNGEG